MNWFKNCVPSSSSLRYGIHTTFDFDMDVFSTLIHPEDRTNVLVFRGDGPYSNQTDIPDNEVVKAIFPKEDGKSYAPFLHAKIAFYCYEDENGNKEYSLMIGSKNIYSYDNVEANLFFVGKLTNVHQEQNEPIIQLLRDIAPFLNENVNEYEAKKKILEKALNDLAFVNFKPVKLKDDYLQHLASNAKGISFHGPTCETLPLFNKSYDEILIVSPFITPNALSSIKKRITKNDKCLILTTPATVESLLHDGFIEERYIFLEEEKFIHAKLFLARKENRFDLFLGSMNLTDYASKKNEEMMVELSDIPVTDFVSFLSSFFHLDLNEANAIINQFKEKQDKSFLSLTTSITSRRDYYLHLHHNHKYKEEEDLSILKYLFSLKSVKNIQNLLKQTFSTFIPLQKNVVVDGKERTIYSLPFYDQLNLGLINHVLHDYDDLFSKNVYLHTKGRGPKDAFLKIRNDQKFSSYYILRTDIHAFDPSMDRDFLLKAIKDTFGFDSDICHFLSTYAQAKAYRKEDDETIYQDGPAQWTGMPLAGLLENVYLNDLDKAIESKTPFYLRCGDDIIVGLHTKEEAESMLGFIKHSMQDRHLTLSERKTCIASPKDGFLYLGYHIQNGEIDLNPAYIQRAKQAIFQRRKALLRYYSQKGIPSTLRIPSLIRQVNQFLNKIEIKNHFKIITTSASLKQIDDMILELIRVVVTNKKGKDKYQLTINQLRPFGYQSLVNAYYKYIDRNIG